jgi:hypothetical protein
VRTFLFLSLLVAAAPALAGCHSSSRTFDANVRIKRIETVHSDDKGKPISTDVDMVWHECPGDQRQTMRSGREFSSCIHKYKTDDVVPAKVVWEWDEHGHYDHHVVELGGCKAPPVDDDDSSFDSIAECVPSIQHDAVVGFHCDRLPEGELAQKCPWFKRE